MPIQSAERVTPLLKRLSITFSAVYFMTVPFHPFPGSAVIKGLAIATLAAVAWVSSSKMLWLALVASTVGDVLLDLDSGRLFIPGLCAFLTAHLVYTALFASRWPIPLRISLPRLILFPVILAYAAGFAFWLAPELLATNMTLPVTLYICVITTMVITAVGGRLSLYVPIGAALFLMSDSLLAITKFKGSFPLRDYLVWGTYYAAQYFITTGVLRGYSEPSGKGKQKRRAAARA
jgi:uncharacterized membrane protein YhhN